MRDGQYTMPNKGMSKNYDDSGQYDKMPRDSRWSPERTESNTNLRYNRKNDNPPGSTYDKPIKYPDMYYNKAFKEKADDRSANYGNSSSSTYRRSRSPTRDDYSRRHTPAKRRFDKPLGDHIEEISKKYKYDEPYYTHRNNDRTFATGGGKKNSGTPFDFSHKEKFRAPPKSFDRRPNDSRKFEQSTKYDQHASSNISRYQPNIPPFGKKDIKSKGNQPFVNFGHEQQGKSFGPGANANVNNTFHKFRKLIKSRRSITAVRICHGMKDTCGEKGCLLSDDLIFKHTKLAVRARISAILGDSAETDVDALENEYREKFPPNTDLNLLHQIEHEVQQMQRNEPDHTNKFKKGMNVFLHIVLL